MNILYHDYSDQNYNIIIVLLKCSESTGTQTKIHGQHLMLGFVDQIGSLS